MSSKYMNYLLMSNGSIKSCGLNNYGQLGLGDNNDRNAFTKVPNVDNVKQISCGANYSVILLNDGTIMSCGNNVRGQLGLGDTTNRDIFVKVPNISGVKQISCGNEHTFILLNDGSVMSCGYNGTGQLGLGDNTDRSIFTKVSGLSYPISKISCGYYHSGLLDIYGNILMCGNNTSGQLGLGDNPSMKNFITVSNVSGSTDIACGGTHTAIIKNKLVYTTGNNTYGQLGLGNNNGYKVFSSFDKTNVLKVICGENHTVTITSNNTIKSCGSNNYGQLGLGDNVNRTTFINVPNIIVGQIYCMYDSTIVLANNGDLLSCGLNNYGQLGLGDSNDRNAFTKLPIFNKKIYLINKTSEPNNLYTIDITKQDLLQGVTTMSNLDFTNGFENINNVVVNTEYGRPIDIINDTFSLFSKSSDALVKSLPI